MRLRLPFNTIADLFSRYRVTAALAALLLCCSCGHSHIFGVELGMRSEEALDILHKPRTAIAGLPYLSGQKILDDTIVLTPCNIPFRRSFGFDSSDRLAAIGLTHKTTLEKMLTERQCAMTWLVGQFGKPTAERVRDSVSVSLWNVASGELSLEAKPYGPEAFVLIYVYEDKRFSP
jgi:hypothetical protein